MTKEIIKHTIVLIIMIAGFYIFSTWLGEGSRLDDIGILMFMASMVIVGYESIRHIYHFAMIKINSHRYLREIKNG